ncbi:MAG: hypothetical protein ACKVS6_08725 [Planctomycetota bacterium]
MKNRITFAIFISIAPLYTLGCASHFHDSANATLANKAREQAAELLKGEEAVFSSMASNLARVSEDKEKAFEAFNASVIAAASSEVLDPEFTWEMFTKLLDKQQKQLVKDREAWSRRLDETLNELTNEEAGIPKLYEKAGDALKAANQQLSAAEEKANQWNRKIAVIEKVIELIPSSLASTDASGVGALKDIAKDLAGSVADAKITFQSVSRTANGKILIQEKTEDLKDAAGEIFDDAKALLKDVKETDALAAEIKLIFTPEAPGAALALAAMAKDLAEAERERYRLQIHTAEERSQNIVATIKEIDRAQDHLVSARKKITNVQVFKINRAVIQDIQDWSAGGPPANAIDGVADPLKNALSAVESYISSRNCRLRVAAFERADARALHFNSIQISRQAVRQRDALIAHGIDTLAMYHSGGVKSSQLAEVLYRIVQLGALSWIGIGVN